MNKNVLSIAAAMIFTVTLAMPFASEAKKKHHGKKASHSASKKSKKAKKAPKTTTEPSSVPADGAAAPSVAAPGGDASK